MFFSFVGWFASSLGGNSSPHWFKELCSRVHVHVCVLGGFSGGKYKSWAFVDKRRSYAPVEKSLRLYNLVKSEWKCGFWVRLPKMFLGASVLEFWIGVKAGRGRTLWSSLVGRSLCKLFVCCCCCWCELGNKPCLLEMWEGCILNSQCSKSKSKAIATKPVVCKDWEGKFSCYWSSIWILFWWRRT